MKPEFEVNGLEFSEVLGKCSWCKALELGKDGWRLPERWELLMLYEKEPESRLDIWLWSASPYDLNNSFAWQVNLHYGNDGYNHKPYRFAVRLVREAL